MNDTTDTKGRLLEVAIKLFAQHGYDGTSIRAITSEADANLGAVTYHFGSKEELYRLSLASLWGPILDEMEAAAQADGSALDRIERTVRTFFAGANSRRELAAIMSHNLPLDRPTPEPMQDAVRRIFRLMGMMVAAGQSSGEIVVGEPRLLILSVIAQPFHVAMMRHRMPAVLGIEAEADAMYERIVDNAVAFIRRGLANVETSL